MLILHATNPDFFEQILSDGKLKPSSKTKNKEQNPNDFYSPYINSFMNILIQFQKQW